ncbi:hypothetical protein Tco_1070813 [Tanacetum coccineum]|uniref:Uncharacterized protein n=1 Tax=Tanacetum coccineum TaxID=301880 RepID=A0ABQ5HNS3_9ASTR
MEDKSVKINKHVNMALGLNDTTPRVAKEVVSPSVVDDTVEKEKLSHVVTTTKSYLPLPTHVTTLAGNAPGKSSYANVTGKPSGKKLNFRTLFTPGGNGIDVVVPVDSIRIVSERFANIKYGFFLGKAARLPDYSPFNVALWTGWMLCLRMDHGS